MTLNGDFKTNRNPNGFFDPLMEKCAVGKFYNPKSQRRAPSKGEAKSLEPYKRDWFTITLAVLTALSPIAVALINKVL